MQLNRPRRFSCSRGRHRPSLVRVMPWPCYLLAVTCIVMQRHVFILFWDVQQDEIREYTEETADRGFYVHVSYNHDLPKLEETIVSRDQMFVSKNFKTTFDREELTEEEYIFLIFTAPPKFDRKTLPGTMARWHNVLHGCGRFVVFTNDHQTQNVCRLNNIPTICVQHTNEGVP